MIHDLYLVCCSLNPVIDIGQTEGAYVMGLGNFLSEDTLFDKETGRILTDGTWVRYSLLFFFCLPQHTTTSAVFMK